MKQDKSLFRLLIALLAVGGVAAVAVVAFYAYHFSGGITTDSGKWGEFGDFFGGTLNPIFASLSFTALVLALAVQTRQLHISAEQLELSRAELEATRRELERAASAQAMTAEALARQVDMAALSAKITALSVAIESLDKELARYSGILDPSHSAHSVKTNLINRRSSLESDLGKAIERVRSAA